MGALAVNGTASPLAAWEHGKIGLSWGGAGFLIIYYAGVIHVLKQLGIIHESTRVAGISSGALTAGAICSGMGEAEFQRTVSEMLDICRRSSCAGKMDKIMRDLLERKLPPDAAQKCSGRFFAGVTVVDGGGPKSVMTWEGFKDRSDLIETLAASTFIPIWSSNRLTTSWRGQETADGSLSAKQPCPPGVEYCLRVSSRWPDLPRPTMPETFNAIARALGGRASSAASMFKPKLPDVASVKADPSRVEAMKSAGVDIAPGLAVARHSSWDAPTWTELGLIPCDEKTCDWLFRMGQLDAMAWADAVGIKEAALAKARAKDAEMERGHGGDKAAKKQHAKQASGRRAAL